MSIQTKVQAALLGAAGITALVPSARIKPLGDWQLLAKPYIVHFPVAATAEHGHFGIVGLTSWGFYQITAVGESYSQAEAVAQAIKAAFNSYFAAGVQIMWTGTAGPIYDSDTKTCEIPMNFEVWGDATD